MHGPHERLAKPWISPGGIPVPGGKSQTFGLAVGRRRAGRGRAVSRKVRHSHFPGIASATRPRLGFRRNGRQPGLRSVSITVIARAIAIAVVATVQCRPGQVGQVTLGSGGATGRRGWRPTPGTASVRHRPPSRITTLAIATAAALSCAAGPAGPLPRAGSRSRASIRPVHLPTSYTGTAHGVAGTLAGSVPACRGDRWGRRPSTSARPQCP